MKAREGLRLGELAVRGKLISREQLGECLEIQSFARSEGDEVPLGRVFRDMDYLPAAQLETLLHLQRFLHARLDGMDLADHAVREGVVTRATADQCVDLQQRLYREEDRVVPLDEILLEKARLSRKGSSRLRELRDARDEARALTG